MSKNSQLDFLRVKSSPNLVSAMERENERFSYHHLTKSWAKHRKSPSECHHFRIWALIFCPPDSVDMTWEKDTLLMFWLSFSHYHHQFILWFLSGFLLKSFTSPRAPVHLEWEGHKIMLLKIRDSWGKRKLPFLYSFSFFCWLWRLPSFSFLWAATMPLT